MTAALEWSRRLASLSPGQPPCPGFRPDQWVEILSNARRFVDDFGPEADRLGWDTLTLFGYHPQHGVIRSDWTGVLLTSLYPVLEVEADYLTKYPWTIPRHKPGRYRGIPVWEFGRG